MSAVAVLRSPPAARGGAAAQAALRRALALALAVQGRTHPNPPVGAVVLADDGAVVGEGATQPAGGAHAEVMALRAAGARARGGTLAVTLEPCNHRGRTPPCTQAILAAGIARAAVALRDANPRVCGGGIDHLRRQGVEVEVAGGRAARQAAALAHGHFKLAATGRPHLTAKWAMTLDGKVARPRGGGRITGAAAWRRVHDERNAADAVVTGVGSIQVDDSRLTVRPPPPDGRQPVRVVVDSQARCPLDARVLHAPGEALIVTGAAAPDHRRRRLERAGAAVLTCPVDAAGRVDLGAALDALGAHGLTTLLCEAGPTLTGALLAADAVDRLVVFVAPWVMGAGLAAPAPAAAVSRRLLDPLQATAVGPDVMLEGALHRYGPEAA